jgi:hypothetical protein
MKFLKRLFGICETPLPGDPQAWSVKDGSVRIVLSRMPELKTPGSGVRLEGGNSTPDCWCSTAMTGNTMPLKTAVPTWAGAST